LQSRNYPCIAPLAQNTSGFGNLPAVRVSQQLDQILTWEFGEVQQRLGLAPLRGDLVNAAVGAVPVIDGVDVVGPLVVPVHDVECAVGADEAVDGAEPGVVGFQQHAAVPGFEGGFERLHDVPVHFAGEQVAGDVGVAETCGQGVAAVDDAPAG